MARVLVVDDQKIFRLTVARMLEDAGHETRAASDGPAGLDHARAWLPDVIILDVHMPDMGGFEVVERLKEDAGTRAIPVVFLTGEPPTDELIVRGLEMGASDFLSKECSKAELLARVGVMARIKRSHDELAAVASISESLLRTLEPVDIADHFVLELRQVFRGTGSLLCIEHSDPERQLRVSSGVGLQSGRSRALSGALRSTLERGSEDAATLDLTGDQRLGPLPDDATFRSAVATVIRRDDQSLLVCVFADREGAYRPDLDPPLLQILARQAALAIDHAMLHARTRRQARELERAMSERSRFFASLSHELRTPINAVIGYNHLLQEQIFGTLTERQTEALSKANRSARHLLELVDDILDISKIEAGKLEVVPEEVDIIDLTLDTSTSVRLQAEQKGLDLTVSGPDSLIMTTDPARFRQILLNLLSNAVKFTEEGSVAVEVRLADTEQGADGKELRVSVSDTGPGISAEDRSRIFEEFEQVVAGERTGTGLGLAISRRLAELLGGSLDLRSEPGVGSTFTLRLPLEWQGRDAPGD